MGTSEGDDCVVSLCGDITTRGCLESPNQGFVVGGDRVEQYIGGDRVEQYIGGDRVGRYIVVDGGVGLYIRRK